MRHWLSPRTASGAATVTAAAASSCLAHAAQRDNKERCIKQNGWSAVVFEESTDVAAEADELRLAPDSKQSDWPTSDSMTAMKMQEPSHSHFSSLSILMTARFIVVFLRLTSSLVRAILRYVSENDISAP